MPPGAGSQIRATQGIPEQWHGTGLDLVRIMYMRHNSTRIAGVVLSEFLLSIVPRGDRASVTRTTDKGVLSSE